MPSVNKQSLREEFDQLKNEFEHLSDDGKVTIVGNPIFPMNTVIMRYVVRTCCGN